MYKKYWIIEDCYRSHKCSTSMNSFRQMKWSVNRTDQKIAVLMAAESINTRVVHPTHRQGKQTISHNRLHFSLMKYE